METTSCTLHDDGRIIFKTFLLVSLVERTTGKTDLDDCILPDIVTPTRKDFLFSFLR